MQENKVVVNKYYGGFGLSESAAEYLREKYYIAYQMLSGFIFLSEELERHDPRLVEVVEVLGKEASGRFARLVVQTIKGNIYYIEEYDGYESVITPDNQEWITI